MEESRDVTDDIVYEILLRLPVKTLKRFQCVRKSWLSLISSPQFQKHHFRLAQQNSPHLLTLRINHTPWNPDEDLNLRFSTYNNNGGTLTLANNFSKAPPRPYLEPFIQSCLGLICISQPCVVFILISNPSTEELFFLPPIEQEANPCVGFDYASSTEEFRVVSFSYTIDSARCLVFTLGASRHWREVRPPPFPVCYVTAPFLHGAVHFLPLVSEGGVQETDFIAVFDINTEDYREGIPLPAYYHSLGDCKGHGISTTDNFIHLTKLGGSLCLTFDFGELRYRLELWLLKDYNRAKWVKGYTIDLTTAVYPYRSYSFWAYPTDNTGDDILLNCSNEMGLKVLSYDPKDGSVKVVKDKEWGATFYVESFYPLGSLTDLR